MVDDTPAWLQRAASIGWRLLVVGAVAYFGFQVFARISVVVLAVVLALFPASVMWGPVRSLERRGWPPILATWAVLIASAAFLTGVGLLVIPAVGEGLGPLGQDLATAYRDLQQWLVEGPLALSQAEVDRYADMLVEQFQERAAGIGSGLLTGAVVAFEVVTGLFLALIVTFFMLKDGKRLFEKLLTRLDPDRADRVGRGGWVAWQTLGRYVRGLAIVGLVDATAIAIGLLIVGVPLVIPLALLVFIGAFFPVVGAFASGLVAVAVALVNEGLTAGLIVLAIVVAVQQLEGDVILPIVFGRTMQLHPLVILLAIAVGGVAFGIVGAFLSVPVAAVIVAVNQELSQDAEGSFVSLAGSID